MQQGYVHRLPPPYGRPATTGSGALNQAGPPPGPLGQYQYQNVPPPPPPPRQDLQPPPAPQWTNTGSQAPPPPGWQASTPQPPAPPPTNSVYNPGTYGPMPGGIQSPVDTRPNQTFYPPVPPLNSQRPQTTQPWTQTQNPPPAPAQYAQPQQQQQFSQQQVQQSPAQAYQNQAPQRPPSIVYTSQGQLQQSPIDNPARISPALPPRNNATPQQQYQSPYVAQPPPPQQIQQSYSQPQHSGQVQDQYQQPPPLPPLPPEHQAWVQQQSKPVYSNHPTTHHYEPQPPQQQIQQQGQPNIQYSHQPPTHHFDPGAQQPGGSNQPPFHTHQVQYNTAAPPPVSGTPGGSYFPPAPNVGQVQGQHYSQNPPQINNLGSPAPPAPTGPHQQLGSQFSPTQQAAVQQPAYSNTPSGGYIAAPTTNAPSWNQQGAAPPSLSETTPDLEAGGSNFAPARYGLQQVYQQGGQPPQTEQHQFQPQPPSKASIAQQQVQQSPQQWASSGPAGPSIPPNQTMVNQPPGPQPPNQPGQPGAPGWAPGQDQGWRAQQQQPQQNMVLDQNQQYTQQQPPQVQPQYQTQQQQQQSWNTGRPQSIIQSPPPIQQQPLPPNSGQPQNYVQSPPPTQAPLPQPQIGDQGQVNQSYGAPAQGQYEHVQRDPIPPQQQQSQTQSPAQIHNSVAYATNQQRQESPLRKPIPTPPKPPAKVAELKKEDEPSTSATALGFGGPSDWEHFGTGAEDEVDDTALINERAGKSSLHVEPPMQITAELPGQPSPRLPHPDLHQQPMSYQENHSWPSPPAPTPVRQTGHPGGIGSATPPPLHTHDSQDFAPTPPPKPQQGYGLPGSPSAPSIMSVDSMPVTRPQETSCVRAGGPLSQSMVSQPSMHSSPPALPTGQSFVMEDSIVLAPPQESNHKPPLEEHAAQSFVMDGGGYSGVVTEPKPKKPSPMREPAAQGFVMDDGGWPPAQQTQQKQQVPITPPESQSFVMGDSMPIIQPQVSHQDSRQAESPHPTSQSFVMGDAIIASPPIQQAQDTADERNVPDTGPFPLTSTSDPYARFDPWYKDSISRYVEMIEKETRASSDEERLKVFTEFMTSEAHLRGQKYSSALTIYSPIASHNDSVSRDYPTSVPMARKISVPIIVAEPKNQNAIEHPVVHPEEHHYSLLPEAKAQYAEGRPTIPNEHQYGGGLPNPNVIASEPQLQPAGDRRKLNADERQYSDGIPNRDAIVSEVVHGREKESTRRSPSPDDDTEYYSDGRPKLNYRLPSGQSIRTDTPPPKEQATERAKAVMQSPSSNAPIPIIEDHESPRNVEEHATSSNETWMKSSEIKPYAPMASTPADTSNVSKAYVPFSQQIQDEKRPGTPQSRISTPPVEAVKGSPKKPEYIPYTPGAISPPVKEPAYRPFSQPPGPKRQYSLDRAPSSRGPGRPTRRDTIGEAPAKGPVAVVKARDETFIDHGQPEQTSFFGGPIVSKPENEASEPDSEKNAPTPTTSQSRDPSPSAAPSQDLVAALSALLSGITIPKTVDTSKYSPMQAVDAIPDDFKFVTEIISGWEAGAKKIRDQNEKDRRIRQEEQEEEADRLFSEQEIGYGDISNLEEDFKNREREKKSQEDKDEYESFAKEVFENLYNRLQAEIKDLMGHYAYCLDLLRGSPSGLHALNNNVDRPDLFAVMSDTLTIFEKVELRHAKVFEIILQRDKRFKKTVIHPLYSAGKIAKMKEMEKHFDEAEKKAVFDAAKQKEQRVKALMHAVEDILIGGLEGNLNDMDQIVKIVHQLNTSDSNIAAQNAQILQSELTTAQAVIRAITDSSIKLLHAFHTVSLFVNSAENDVSVSEMRLANADTESFAQLHEDKKHEAARLDHELDTRSEMILGDCEHGVAEIEDALHRLSAGAGPDDPEHGERMKRALEAAKMRQAAKDQDGGHEDFA